MNNNNNNNNGQRASFAFFAHTTITTDGKGKSSLFSFLFSSKNFTIGRKAQKSPKRAKAARALLKQFSGGQIPTERDTETRRRSMSSQKTRSFSAPRVPSRKTPPPVLKAGKTSTTQTVSFSPCAGTIKPPPKTEECEEDNRDTTFQTTLDDAPHDDDKSLPFVLLLLLLLLLLLRVSVTSERAAGSLRLGRE